MNTTTQTQKAVATFLIGNSAHHIQLHQSGPDSFQVLYGESLSKKLAYGQACAELGACIMHALACEGQIDSNEGY